MKCRHCKAETTLRFADLGVAPFSNAYLTDKSLNQIEAKYPLRIRVCEKCWLVQTEDFARPDQLFDENYAYFSSYSKSWLAHCRRYADAIIQQLCLSSHHHVVEVGANDGYLLQYFLNRGIPSTGIEPTASTASVAQSKGIKIIPKFFGMKVASAMAANGYHADLMIANNVLAHVQDINDFVRGFAILLKKEGVATFEFPHLIKLVDGNQFDTIYHEHYSYLSLTSVERILGKNGLQVFDVEQLNTHGGSLRVYCQRFNTGRKSIANSVKTFLNAEVAAGVTRKNFYSEFQNKIEKIKIDFVAFLKKTKSENKSVAAYGAAAKGNTLLNYSGIDSSLIAFVADRNPSKQGKYLPGSHIPIVKEDQLWITKPDYVVIFPWNLCDEIRRQLAYISQWGGKFVTAIPNLEVSY